MLALTWHSMSVVRRRKISESYIEAVIYTPAQYLYQSPCNLSFQLSFLHDNMTWFSFLSIDRWLLIFPLIYFLALLSLSLSLCVRFPNFFCFSWSLSKNCSYYFRTYMLGVRNVSDCFPPCSLSFLLYKFIYSRTAYYISVFVPFHPYLYMQSIIHNLENWVWF